MNIIDISKEIVDSLFPNETWTEPYKNVFVALSRLDVFYSWNMQNLKQNKAPNGALSLPQAETNQNSDIFNLTCKNADVNKNGAAE